MSPKWFFRKDDREFGPFTATELRRLAEAKRISLDDLVKFGDHDWWLPSMFNIRAVWNSIRDLADDIFPIADPR